MDSAGFSGVGDRETSNPKDCTFDVLQTLSNRGSSVGEGKRMVCPKVAHVLHHSDAHSSSTPSLAREPSTGAFACGISVGLVGSDLGSHVVHELKRVVHSVAILPQVVITVTVNEKVIGVPVGYV